MGDGVVVGHWMDRVRVVETAALALTVGRLCVCVCQGEGGEGLRAFLSIQRQCIVPACQPAISLQLALTSCSVQQKCIPRHP